MPPWPAWDWSPSGHRGVTLVLHYWGVAVRKKSHRSFPVPGKGLLLPGLLSGVVPSASVPATATYLVLLSPELDGGRRGPCGEDLPLSLSSWVLCPTLRGLAGDYVGVREALLRWQWMRDSGLETFCCLRQLWAGAAVTNVCRYCLSGPLWTRGGRRESDVVFGMILGAVFLSKPKACSALWLWFLLIIWGLLQRRT